MRIPRIFLDQPLQPGSELELDTRANHYLATVLRLKPGRELILFNGQGLDYRAKISRVERKSLTVAIGPACHSAQESPLHSHLGIALSKGDRFDFVIQKATELGVSAITPLVTERVDVKLPPEKHEQRMEHWRQVAISACEQCGRGVLPQLHAPMTLSDWCQTQTAERRLVLHPLAHQPLHSGRQRPTSVALLIGPEGGLSGEEVGQAHQYGFESVLFGPRVLRTETAPITALSILQYLWGDLH